MPPVVSFIGLHNSGKTTLARQIVAHLKKKGYSVGVIKSTKESGIVFEHPQTDTALYKAAGADSVALLAPDQLVVQSKPTRLELLALVQRLFPDMDIVIAEGFKQALNIAKIEVRRKTESPLLRDQVAGVIAVVTDVPLADGLLADALQFRFDQSLEIVALIESRYLDSSAPIAP